jgi:hypothetical protein
MEKQISGIRFLPGRPDILVVAPHGPLIDGQYQNDLRTGVVAEEIHRRLDCCTIINDRYFKPKGVAKSAADYLLDLFRIDHAAKVPGYLDRIRAVADGDGKTLVLWVHGIADEMAVSHALEHISRGLFRGEPAGLHALIGYGQGQDPKTGEVQDRPSARLETATAFRDRLTANGMTALLTREGGSNYRGRDAKRLNQWFNRLGYGFEKVESIQLEIKAQGFRDSDESARNTAGIIARALSELVRPGD